MPALRCADTILHGGVVVSRYYDAYTKQKVIDQLQHAIDELGGGRTTPAAVRMGRVLQMLEEVPPTEDGVYSDSLSN